jgi:hypothetical protein
VIDVPAPGVDRRQRAEPRKYVRAANIPGMDDGIAAGKRRERLRPQQAMGIGNRANGSHHARCHSSELYPARQGLSLNCIRRRNHNSAVTLPVLALFQRVS